MNMKTLINAIVLSSVFASGAALAQSESANPAVLGVDGPVQAVAATEMRSDSHYPTFQIESSKTRADVKADLEAHQAINGDEFVSA